MTHNPLYQSRLKRFMAHLPSFKQTLYFAVILALATTFACIGAGILWFTQNYTIENPVHIQLTCMICTKPGPVPVVIVVTPTPTPTPPPPQTKADMVKASKFAKLIDHIWLRESGRGTSRVGLNTYCESIGKNNEFGYYPQASWCWDTFQEGVTRLDRWFEARSENTDAQKLCEYNTGTISDTCAYLGTDFTKMN